MQKSRILSVIHWVMKLYKDEMAELLREHLKISRDISKHFLKIGKKETSTLIEHYADIVDGKATLKTRISLLPVRRMYTYGTVLVNNEYLTYEMEEDIEL